MVDLGTIRLPSGLIVVADMGYLDMWSEAAAEDARRAGAAGGGEFTLQSVWMVAIGGLPVDTPLRVVGHETEDGWASVSVCVRDLPVAATRELGQVGVDFARLILGDVECLDAWVHEESLDGLADVAFWGLHEEEAQAKFGAEELDEGVYGWEDLPLEEAADRALAIDAWRGEHEKGLAVDFRPHSHHYAVMREVRAVEHEAGGLELAGGRVLGFMTSWGDGIFPVEADQAGDGSVVAVRVRFA